MTNRVGCKKVLIINLISYKRPITCHTNHNVPLALKISRKYGLEIIKWAYYNGRGARGEGAPASLRPPVEAKLV